MKINIETDYGSMGIQGTLVDVATLEELMGFIEARGGRAEVFASGAFITVRIEALGR